MSYGEPILWEKVSVPWGTGSYAEVRISMTVWGAEVKDQQPIPSLFQQEVKR